MEETHISKNQLINSLLHIGHGNLGIYTETGLKGVTWEPELFGHLIAWNHKKGEVRDSKAALPVIALRGDIDLELYENACAHLCMLDPRNLLRALRYHRELPTPVNGAGRLLKDTVVRYLREREKVRAWWDRSALQHRASMKSLYAMNHIRPSARAQRVLFTRQYPAGSVFAALKNLKNMDAPEAAGTILNHRIPFTIAVGALGGIKGKTDIILALIERMSGNEIINNTKALERMGVFENPALRAAFDKAMERAKKDKRVSSLKATMGASVTTGKAQKKLKQVAEQQLEKIGGIEGDWLVLGDRSGSMEESIVVARNVASLIAQQVKGQVHLVFFNTSPTYYDVTDKALDEIQKMTQRMRATGGTAIGCGLDLIADKNMVVNGIAICSDGGDNTHPLFVEAYRRYITKFGIEPTCYLYHVPGEGNWLEQHCKKTNTLLEQFELGSHVDYYSLPNLVKTMRTSRYSLVEEIMDTPLLTFNDVFKTKI